MVFWLEKCTCILRKLTHLERCFINDSLLHEKVEPVNIVYDMVNALGYTFRGHVPHHLEYYCIKHWLHNYRRVH